MNRKDSPKRERVYSRRRMVLRRVAVVLIALLAVDHFMQIGFLLPVQAIRQVEAHQGAPHGETLARLWTPEIHRTHLVYLRGSENAVTIGPEETTLEFTTTTALIGESDFEMLFQFGSAALAELGEVVIEISEITVLQSVLI